MKLRIVKMGHNGKYIVQQKFIFWWVDAICEHFYMACATVEFESEGAARDAIQKLFFPASDTVVWESK